MFDFHMHTGVSFDSEAIPEEMVAAASAAGLKEICFTDHYDYSTDPSAHHDLFTLKTYDDAYGHISSHKVTVRRGVEFGLTRWNKEELATFTGSYPFDFVIGSIHSVRGIDPYEARYWNGKTEREAFEEYLLQSLSCVRAHDGFDVLGHINYVCKSPNSPTHAPLRYRDHSDLCDEIMGELVKKGKGMEINTSGLDRVGAFLPDRDFLLRFKELGGEIVTIGSDAHDPSRVGQYATEAVALLKDIFGYACTFAARKPIFHKL